MKGMIRNDKKYVLSIGLNDKDTKVQKVSTLEAYKMVENTLFNNNIESFTIYDAKGVYKHENGEITKENTLRVEIYAFDGDIKRQVVEIINIIKVVLNQESVALEIVETYSELV